VHIVEGDADGAHHERKSHDRGGESRAVGAEGELDAEVLVQPVAEGSAGAEQHEEDVAHRHRRQHQWQVHEGIEEHAPVEARARQEPRDEDRRR
jgi:hypothetical protein